MYIGGPQWGPDVDVARVAEEHACWGIDGGAGDLFSRALTVQAPQTALYRRWIRTAVNIFSERKSGKESIKSDSCRA